MLGWERVTEKQHSQGGTDNSEKIGNDYDYKRQIAYKYYIQRSRRE